MRPLLLRKGAGASKCATKVSPFLLLGNIAAHNLSGVGAQNTLEVSRCFSTEIVWQVASELPGEISFQYAEICQDALGIHSQ